MKLFQTARDRAIWTTFGLGAAAVTAVLARQGMKAGWEAVRDDEPPENPISYETSWSHALAWTVALALGAGVTRLVVERVAAQVWLRRTGRLPPGL